MAGGRASTCSGPGGIPGDRAVVLGGGLLGSAVGRELRARGWRVDVLGRARLDLTDGTGAEALAGWLDAGALLVFTSAVTPDRDRTEAADRANAAMVETVVQAIRRVPPAACVFVSSTAVYGDAEGDRVITEETPLDPSGGYGLGKAEAEARLAAVAGETGTRLLCLRPSMVYGPGDTHQSYGPSVLARGWRSGEVWLYGDGDDVRDFVYVDDVARAAAVLVERGAEGVYNVGGEGVSFRRVLEIMGELDPREVRITSRPRKLPPSRVTLDLRRLREVVPDHPSVPLREGLRLTLESAGP